MARPTSAASANHAAGDRGGSPSNRANASTPTVCPPARSTIGWYTIRSAPSAIDIGDASAPEVALDGDAPVPLRVRVELGLQLEVVAVNRPVERSHA